MSRGGDGQLGGTTVAAQRIAPVFRKATVTNLAADQEIRMNAMYAEHAGPLLRYLLGLTGGERYAAEDLLQETMLRAWRHIDKTPDGSDGLRRWLFTVARHAAVDSYRRRQFRPEEVELSDGAELVSGDDPVGTVVAADSFRQALAGLTPSQRAIVRDLYLHGRPADQVAELHGIPVGTVKSRAHYALRAIREATNDADAASHLCPLPVNTSETRSSLP